MLISMLFTAIVWDGARKVLGGGRITSATAKCRRARGCTHTVIIKTAPVVHQHLMVIVVVVDLVVASREDHRGSSRKGFGR
jgi:hypothetical protein